MPRPLHLAAALALAACGLASPRAQANDPSATIRQSQQVLAEQVAIAGMEIPQKLLAEAQGVAIVPRVLKVGFVAGLRRGHGVVMTRDADGAWRLPTFITLTGGSLGWQAGVQGTDVVLVFTTRKSVEGLMKGKFTIGADASAAAGPVGRNAAAATDAKLGAEIYSYSRSRGLFLGVSVDGSSIEIDEAKQTQFYGAPSTQPPLQVPEPAMQLLQYLVTLTGNGPGAPGVIPAAPVTPQQLEAARQALAQQAAVLFPLLAPDWQQYLALPREAYDPALAPSAANLAAVEQRYAAVAANPQYQQLASRPEFQATHQLLKQYAATAAAAPQPALQLPQPPAP